MAENLGQCEWCDRPAKMKVPILKKIKGAKGFADSGLSLRCCYGHEEIAKRMADEHGRRD